MKNSAVKLTIEPLFQLINQHHAEVYWGVSALVYFLPADERHALVVFDDDQLCWCCYCCWCCGRTFTGTGQHTVWCPQISSGRALRRCILVKEMEVVKYTNSFHRLFPGSSKRVCLLSPKKTNCQLPRMAQIERLPIREVSPSDGLLKFITYTLHLCLHTGCGHTIWWSWANELITAVMRTTTSNCQKKTAEE